MTPHPATPPGEPAAGRPEEYDEGHTVRPYARTGGRTRPTSSVLPVEALVRSLPAAPPVGTTAEKRQILELTATDFLSVAELSAHVRLPVGVVRVLVSDLVDEGLVRVHGLPSPSSYDPAASLRVLESVLDGMSSL